MCPNYLARDYQGLHVEQAKNMSLVYNVCGILKVNDPGDILIRRSTSTGRECTEFDLMIAEVTSTLGLTGDYLPYVPINIVIGQYYMVRDAKKYNQWCRAKVENIMQGATTYKIM